EKYLCFFCLSFLWDSAFGQIHYSIPEELEHGAIVGNIADDLGLDVIKLPSRRFRIASTAQKRYLKVNLQNGILFLNEKLDREQLCEQKRICLFNIDFILENPLEMHYAEIEILDINDNSPSFAKEDISLSVTESALVGTRIPLEGAQDPDSGTNSLARYHLSLNENFGLDTENRGEDVKIPVLVLEKALDREEQSLYHLLLTAIDGGIPERSGSVRITITVLDSNDNAPLFDQKIYFVNLFENSSKGTLVIKLNATDADEGSNGDVNYYFSSNTGEKVKEMFSLGPHTGEIRVVHPMDFEETNSYQIEVQARDRGHQAMQSHCTIVVKIVDVNDNAPVLSLSSLTSPIEENIQPGTIIALISVTDQDSVQAQDCGIPSLSSSTTVSVFILDQNDSAPQILTPVPKSGSIVATEIIGSSVEPGYLITKIRAYDADIGYNAWLSFQLLQSTDPSIFTIGTYTGEIRTRRPISDRDTPTHTLEILVKDNGKPSLSTTLIMAISILDSTEDSFPPKISSVKEDSFNIDNKSNLTVYLIITLGSVSFMFVVSIVVLITIQCFKWDTKYVPVKIFGSWSAISSRKCPGSNRTRYSNLYIIPGRKRKTFELPLDREQQSDYDLILTAIDGGTPKRTGTLQVTIIVLDSNDNAPLFDQKIYFVNLLENVSKGTLVIKLNATDADEGSNGEVTYSFATNNIDKIKEMFSIDIQSGEIKVEGHVDFEETSDYEIEIQARDGGQAIMSSQCTVVVKVIDVNDNTPLVSINSLSYVIKENEPPGAIVALISVTDRDSDENGRIHCKISKGMPFKLKSSLKTNFYSIVTENFLDRESDPEYNITILATDYGFPSLSSSARIQVTILDINDNPPHFHQSFYTIYVKENNVPGTSIFTVSAYDPDWKENALVTYSISESITDHSISGLVSVNSENGIILASSSFDFEQLKYFSFEVQARDYGIPSLTSTTTVDVFILDQNDNAPQILSPMPKTGSTVVEANISRSVTSNFLVTKIRTYDADIGYNAWLSFELLQPTDPCLFSIGLYTGEVRTTRSFAGTNVAIQTLQILVKDNGKPPLSTTLTMAVSISDSTEDSFSSSAFSNKDYSLYPEKPPNMTLYLIITLGSISFVFILSIIILTGIQCSKYKRKTMTQTSAPYFNYEEKICKVLRMKTEGEMRYATAKPKPSLGSTFSPRSHSVAVALPDLRVSVFGQIRYSIPEELEKGSFVGNIANDLGLDVTTLSPRRFRIMSAAQSDYIEVNLQNGILFINKKIDREQLCGKSLMCFLNLEFLIENPLQVHYVEIEVVDINDNCPFFSEVKLLLSIAESAPSGTRIPLESAQDPDVGTNSLSSYILSPNNIFLLDTDNRSGHSKIPILILEMPLDREQQPLHHILLTAIDGGIPQRSGTLQITINVLDSNDNAPVFDQEIYFVGLFENSRKDTLLIRLNATDADEGSNGEVNYLFSGNTKDRVKNMFRIDPHTGEIMVEGLVDFEDVSTYEIEVQAHDRGHQPMVSHCNVVVKVIDINDNAPMLSVNSLISPIQEDVPKGTIVALINVQDRDDGDNGRVHTEIPRNIPFKLNPSLKANFFSLVSNGILDREAISEYNITITATDSGSPPLSSSTTISVKISDINDNPPCFDQSFYTVYVNENNVPGASFFSVNATDSDWNENARVAYSIIEGNIKDNSVTDFLSISSGTGKIFTSTSFDFEQLKFFSFLVQARDSGIPSLSSTATINVFILDENDNAPQVLSPVPKSGSLMATITVPRSVDSGYLVTKIRAYDADIGYNAWLSFELPHLTVPNLFTLGRYTGEIRTLRPFVDRDVSSHSIVILVKDNGKHPLSTTLSLVISILESTEPIDPLKVSSLIETSSSGTEYTSNTTIYLIITLGSISFIFLLSVILIISIQLCKPKHKNRSHLCTPYSNYTSLLCLHIKYRENNKKKLLFVKGPRESLKATNIHWTYACLIVSVIWNIVSGQIRYSVSEEVGQGTFIGNIAKDLGLNIKQLSNRKFQIASTVQNNYIDANLQNGKLLIKEKMDRENLCGQKTVCFLNIEFVMENPFEIHYAEIEILDVNDNSPIFPKESTLFSVAESSQVGTRIPLESAEDSDVGMNSVAGYELSRNDNFVLDIENRGEGSKIPYLVLEKPLDREKQPVYHLLLTATDGGEPQRSGTLQITVTVLDSNDNAPRFDQKVYSVSLLENSSEGTLVIKINATDADEGSNGVVNYFFGSRTTEKVKNIFALDHKTGEIIVKELTDFEEETYFEIEVQARDGGQPELISHCTVVVKIIDVNDNSPVISISSSLGIIKEDAKPGSMVALISIRDPDSGENGQVHCQVSENMPFKLIPSLKANLYSLVSGDSFDREVNSEYNITITAIDSGSPPLSSSTTIYVQISDINDNPPRFGQSSYTVYVMENNVPGASIFSVDAIDPDWKENAMVTYSILENKFKGNSESPFVSVNSDNGNIFALDSFDFERVKHFSFQVQAQDSGTPSLSSTTTINVFVLDQNDNAPKILSPVPKMGSKLATETVSKFVNSGHLVTKLRAYDADIGYNAWLCFQLLQSTDPTLFTIGIYTGEVRTRRPFVDRDASTQELVLLVKDNGDPQLSATLTMAISLLSSLVFFSLNDICKVLCQGSTSNSPGSAMTILKRPELEQGAFVGNIAKDLGLDVTSLSARRFRIMSTAQSNYIQVNLKNGILFINRKIDREQLCGKSLLCLLNLEFLIENPLQVHYAEIEVLDINDNSPFFSDVKLLLSAAESAATGTRIPLESAEDLDVGTNSLSRYKLSPNNYFLLDTDNRSGRSKIPTLVIESSLDREQQPVHHLLLTAIDGGIPERSGSLQITINVLDSNDNAPVFDQEIYFVNLLENSRKGTLLIKLNATDADEGSNGEVNYLFSSNTKDRVKNVFRIDPHAGEIKVEGLVDFEEQNEYEIEVQARDGGQPVFKSHCNVVVKIIDINDNAPMLSVSSLNSPIQEDVPKGTIVALINVQDRDDGDNGRVHTEIPRNIPFKLNPSLKANFFSLVSNGILDREAISEYNITITATDSGSPPLSSSTTISVKISDINDNPPCFDQSFYTVYVNENNVPGASFFSVNATDSDWNENARVAYSIIEGNIKDNSVTDFLSISSGTGKIFTSTSFDFEQLKFFSFLVQARDSGIPSLSSTATINVFILDENDNAPQVLSPVPKSGSLMATITVPRSVDSGYLVTKIRAYDADIGYNAWLSFELPHLTVPNLFTLGRYTGEIRTLRPFVDRDVSSHSIVILVKDNGKHPLSTTLSLVISILFPLKCNSDNKHPIVQTKAQNEMNGNGSQYQSYKMRLSQQSTTDLILVKPLEPIKSTNIGVQNSGCEKAASTAENGLEFSNIIWFINYVDVQTNSDNSKSPELVLIKALDREQQPTQILTLTAIDGGNPVRYGTALITVSVQDANDNTPVFDQSVYKISLIENVPNGTLLIKIQATDLDEGPNAEIFYSLSVLIPDNARTVFTIDGKTGEMRVTAPVDFEESNIYEIHVQATDNGHFAMTGHCKVLVEIIDTNDNNPEVTVTSLSSPVKEDTLPGSVIALINVADRDSGMNGQVHCHISGAPPFQLKLNFLNYYALLLNKPLDREIISEYNITITATDSGTPPLSTSKTVLVQVSDVNDNAPRFLAPSYTFSIRENNVPGSLIFTVSALDPDLEQNAMIKYAILETTVLSVPISSYISMKSDSGVIYAMQSFDHEKVKVLQFEVKAEDGGFPSLSSNVTIHLFILDQNDNIPTILPPYSSNGSPLTTVTLTILVMDSDQKLLEMSDYGLRSKIEDPVSYMNLYLIVAIVSISMIFLLTIITFVALRYHYSQNITNTKAIYKVRLKENTPNGTLVIKLNATDLDKGQNGEIFYSFSSLVPNHLRKLFNIKPNTGEILVLEAFDFEESNTYEIHVQAKDKGQVPMIGHCKVLVEIIDINDNYPEITVTSLSSPIPENAPTGTLIALFTMSDRDSGVNGKINCYISQNIPFKIEANYKNYYSLVLNEQIDRESIAQYRVTIIAIDGGSPSLSTTEIILVEVSDVNDNAPTFSKPFYTVFVKENNVPGSLIFTLSASDPDLNENGLLTYTILEKIIMDAPISSWVSIKPNCGSIYTLKSFDYEHLKLFQFEVEAEDAGSPSLNSSATVSIFILDENDNAPAILAPHHNDGSSVTENMPRTAKVGHFVTKIRAVDFDSGHNAWLSYQLLHPIVAPIFSAGLYTGEIRTVRPLRDEDKNEQELVILVTDHGKIPQSSTLSLTISIVDEVQETTSDFRKLYKNSESFSDINFYLIIAITFITIIFLLTIIIFTFVRYQKSQNSRNNYGRPSSCGNTGRSWTYSQSHGYQLYFKADTSKGDLTALNSQFPHTSEKPMLNNG
uniref:Cadherin domain-containing protein n=1 Tax=Latimeria chalumnae TaxID=7897 RepID=H3AK35_LATCH